MLQPNEHICVWSKEWSPQTQHNRQQHHHDRIDWTGMALIDDADWSNNGDGGGGGGLPLVCFKSILTL